MLVSSTLPDLIDDDACEQFAARGVAPLSGIHTALSVAAALRRPDGDPARMREIAAATSAGAAPHAAGEWLDEAEAKELLAEAGIEVPRGTVVADADAAVAALDELQAPVALKLSAPGLLHKTEAGALVLSLYSEGEVREAFEWLASIEAPAGGRVLVEEMASTEVELLVAAQREGIVPSLVIGLGGVWTEVLDDVAVIPLPASPARVETAIRSLRGAPLLTGARGRQALDVEAAARVASAAGSLLLDAQLDLIELNPVFVAAEGAIAVDAVIRRSAAETRAEAA